MINNTPNEKSWLDMSYEERWSPSSLEMVCDIWKLDAEKAIPHLRQLQGRLQDLKDYPLTHPLELARCYVDSNFQLTQTEDKFRRLVAWRQQEGIDELLLYQPPTLLQEHYPSCFLEGLDKDGDPIWIDRVGASDVWAVYNAFGAEAFRKSILRTREVALRGEFARDYERQTGRPPARVTVIMDMEGLCRRHLQAGLIAPLEEHIGFLQDYYGGLPKRILVTKAPWVFRIVWSIAQHFCNESLKKSIAFCNAKNTQTILDQYMDRTVLPPAFCAQGQGRPGVGMAQTSMEGGVMPPLENELPKLKTAGSSSTETVATCDSSTASPRNSSNSTSSLRSERQAVVPVKTTSLLSGFLVGSDRVLLEF